MFHNLTRYVIDQWLPQTTSSTAAEGVESNTTTSSRLTSAEAEDDWVLVDRRSDDSEGNSKSSSLESLNLEQEDDDDDGLIVVERSPDRVVVVNTGSLPVPALLTRTNSVPRVTTTTSMEESWFLTPPPCFISTGPVHMETSPLENLLIEHPSMSVYTHHGRRYNHFEEVEAEPEEVEVVVAVEEAGDSDDEGAVLVHRAPRVNRVHVLQQQERQGVKSKHAQKIQIQKSCKFVTRSTLDRTNKAREVNSRNRRQRRGERSQGAKRSYANNNRKC
ncbi:tumor protein p53-inducible nuclear protein 2 [Tribolium castaneum]|nr:PREDICTED: tumor protein p53-inducible nuclear protein 2 [Tribolium castaneum]EFA01105.1 hypothetical protein TcasGA2_TC004030 [Tribolium castaneum]|eukprot:XP_966636.1 PREDICTED: tumor protein p53-inducible nuclear protein 2 [Tribolium castaneum]